MALISLRSLKGRMFRNSTRISERTPVRLGAEFLEDRSVPATITVTSLADNVTDDTVVTLREAIQSINDQADLNDEVGANRVGAYGTNDTIVFQAGLTGTITLALGQYLLEDPVQINGPGASVITIDAGNLTRHFDINSGMGSGFDYGLSGLTLINGNSALDNGGSIRNTGQDVTLTNMQFTSNKSLATGAGNGGGAVASTNSGNLIVSNSNFTGNTALGASGNGGAILIGAGGSLSITGGTFSGNQAARAGGAIENDGSVTATTVNILRTVFDMNSAGVNGGAFHTSGDSDATFSGVTITNNTAAAEGGGLWNSKTGIMTITDAGGNVLISGNTANGDAAVVLPSDFTNLQGGGGIFNDGTADGTGAGADGTGGTLMILDESATNTVTISGNTATGANRGSGGGLLSIGGNVTINGVTFSGNEAIRAGGAIEIASGGTVTISKSTFSNNDVSADVGVLTTANPGNGGAIHVTNQATISIADSSFTSNVASKEGGAIWNSDKASMTIARTTIFGNTALTGGGVFQDAGTTGGGVLTITASTIAANNATGTTAPVTGGGGILSEDGTVSISNSTISGNTAQTFGGGIGVLGGTVDIRNSTIAKNAAIVEGGGIDQDTGTGTVTVVSTIIALNMAPTGPDFDGTVTSTGNNLFGNTSGTTIVGGTNDLTNVNPLLGPLANNGGPTLTHALLTGSPAINTGSNPAPLLTTDQRGGAFARTFGAGTDIGAFEAQPINSTTTLTASPTSAGQNQPVTLTATVTVPGGVATPTGTVTFVNTTTGETLGTANLVNGVATLTVTTLPSGTNAIQATYNGDLNANASMSNTVNVTVAAFFANGSSFGTGGGAGTAILRATDGTVLLNVQPFGPGFTGGVRVATGDFNGDGTPDLVVGNGPGIASQVFVLDGKTGAQLFAINPFEATFLGGVFVAAGDINADGVPELIITPDQGGGPRVRVFDGATFTQIADFFGITDPAFRGGARAGVADINGDGFGDLIVSAGFLGGPRVAVWNGTSFVVGMEPVKLINDIFVFEDTLRNGAFVTGADVNGDGFAELIAGAGPGGGPRVVAYDGMALLTGQQILVSSFFAGDPNNRNGVPVSVADFDGNGLPDILTGTGEPIPGTPGTLSPATVYTATSLADASPTPLAMFEPFPGFTGGVFVG